MTQLSRTAAAVERLSTLDPVAANAAAERFRADVAEEMRIALLRGGVQQKLLVERELFFDRHGEPRSTAYISRRLSGREDLDIKDLFLLALAGDVEFEVRIGTVTVAASRVNER